LQGGSMPNTSSSVPFLLSSSMSSIRSGGSRRTSACLGLSGSPGASSAGLLQQLGSGMVRTLSSAASSAYSYSPYSSQHHSPRGSFSSQGGGSSNVRISSMQKSTTCTAIASHTHFFSVLFFLPTRLCRLSLLLLHFEILCS
jgi:hypothetical protein